MNHSSTEHALGVLPTHVRVEVVGDPRDPRVEDYVSLTDMDLRMRSEQAEGIFIAESFFVLERVIQSHMSIRSVLVETRRLHRVVEQLSHFTGDITVYVAEPEVLKALVGYRVHRGVLASVHRPPARTMTEVLAGTGDIILLEGLVDPTNVGLAFRSAAAMDFTAAVVSPDCADPLYRRAVRTSMGSVLHMPWARSDCWSDTLDQIKSSGIEIIALTPGLQAPDLKDVLADVDRRGARIGAAFGAEGHGLSEYTLTAADYLARIPMGQGVDSLNVGATVAVVGFALRNT